MSFLNPVNEPVKVYKWNDVGAPVLDRTSGCLMNIFKECLVTGYGGKAGAGWTLPFEDTGVKVLRPELGADIDFFLRLSGDSGTTMSAQVYLRMTDANTGDLKLQCDTAFKYAKTTTTKWLLVATSRGFWFSSESYDVPTNMNKKGSYFFVGDVQGESARTVFLQHTGGTSAAYYSSITGVATTAGATDKGGRYYVNGKILNNDESVDTASPRSFFNGTTVETNDSHLSQLILIANNKINIMPCVFASSNGSKSSNFAELDVVESGVSRSFVCFGTSDFLESNFYIATDYWVY